MNSQPVQKEVVVVGGGLAGLTAACYLARGGASVTLFEKASHLGGKASTQKYDEYYFNRGIHALYCGGATEQVLKELGVSYSGHSPKTTYVLRQGQLAVAPAGVTSLLRNKLLTFSNKFELISLFSTLPRIKPAKFGHVSVQEWLGNTLHRPKVRQFMAAVARTFVYSSALDLVSAEVFILKMQLALKHPVLYIDGGWQTLVEGLRKAAEQDGARLESGVRVEAVEHHDGYVQSVRLSDGRSLSASAVILATSPREAVKLVDQGNYPPLRQIVDGLVPAQLACLDVALSHLPNPRYPIVQDLEHPRFMSTQSLYSHISPAGGALIHTFKQLDPRHPGDPHEDERDLEDFLDTVQPGWREVLVKRVYLPRIEPIGMLPTASGGGYTSRPDPQVPGLANLYLAGDWVGSEGFLADASMASARQVAQRLLEAGTLSSVKRVSANL